MEKSNRYLELSRLDYSHGVEVKHGGLKYLKWSVAWHLLMTLYPDATYSYDEPITLPDGTMLVRTSVRVGDTVHSMQLPILDQEQTTKQPEQLRLQHGCTAMPDQEHCNVWCCD